jgi:hypothetical protein
MNGIRRFFSERNPDARALLMLSTHDDVIGVSRSRGNYDLAVSAGPRQLLVSPPGTVAVVDGILVAALVTLIAGYLKASLPLAFGVGAVAGVALLIALLLHELHAFASFLRLHPVRYPTPGGTIAIPRALARLARFTPEELAALSGRLRDEHRPTA